MCRLGAQFVLHYGVCNYAAVFVYERAVNRKELKKMMYRWLLAFKKPSNKLWINPTLGALFAVLFAFMARLFNIYLPEDILPKIELSTLEGLLDVIASSMLAVSTFSLSIMVSAFSSAASGATPRATELVMGDNNTRIAIASFISAFIYAIVARTALGMEFYGQNGRFVLFVSTILVLVYLIVTLIRWVHTLSQLGRMGNTLNKIHAAAENSLLNYRTQPNMGATWHGNIGQKSVMVEAQSSGYLTHIDMATLQSKAEAQDWHIYIAVRPGELIMPGTVLAMVDKGGEEAADLHNCFLLEVERNYAQDPSWGFIVMSEAAQRALSPAVNDPGTAINVMTRMMRLLVDTKPDEEENKKSYDRLAIKPLDCGDWVRDGFAPLARDGAGILEVGLVMQKVLAAIWKSVPETEVSRAAEEMSALAFKRAEQELGFEPDVAVLRGKREALFGTAES